MRSDVRYVHVTSNETIEGIQLRELPDLGVPLVVDVSSDFLTRSIEWERVDVVYGGVQKNLGPAGLAVVVIRRSALDECVADLPSYLSFPSHAKAGSLLNTPPMFSVYVTGKMLRWIEDRGGLQGMAERAERRSGRIYDVIEASAASTPRRRSRKPGRGRMSSSGWPTPTSTLASSPRRGPRGW